MELQLGLAAAALGRLDAAVGDLQAAASICDANGARGYAVQARVELAAALTRRQAPGDLDRARAALDAAAGEAERLGMVPFTERIGRLRARLPAAAAAGSPHNPPQDIDGLLAWAADSDENGLNVVAIWQSQAHQERFAAEQLFPAFQELGVAEHVMANSEVTTYEVGELYIR